MNLAVIVPYRDRAEHLQEFVPAVTSCLLGPGGSAFTAHHIYVVEQVDEKPFNRGKLLNVGYKLVAERSLLQRALGYPVQPFTHVALHDVDLLPEAVDYGPCDRPTHLAQHCSQFGLHGMPRDCFGGVTLFPVADFLRVNGHNNDYQGWGAEDDDLLDRCRYHGVPTDRRPGVFRSLPHPPSLEMPGVRALYSEAYRRLLRNRAGQHEYDTNGLNTTTFTFKGWHAYATNTTRLKVTL